VRAAPFLSVLRPTVEHDIFSAGCRT